MSLVQGRMVLVWTRTVAIGIEVRAQVRESFRT